MIFKIPKGKHRARPLRFGIWWARRICAWEVLFTHSCRYNLQSDDQLDTNKLCGVGYLPNHHKDSARFGWRYVIEKDAIELMAYCYVNGERKIESICFCDINKPYKITLDTLGGYTFSVDEHVTNYYRRIVGYKCIPHNHKKKFKYRLGVYFGGNQVAPHDISINLSRL